jgi:signal transduction histidine kinase
MLPHIRADEVLLRQAFTNLLQNAIESMPEGGELKISGFVDDYAYPLRYWSWIPSIRDKIFLPFILPKRAGLGLGLAIITDHRLYGGDIRFSDRHELHDQVSQKLIVS